MAPILAEFILEDEKLVTDGIPSDSQYRLIFSKSRIKRNRINLLNSNYIEIDFRKLEEDKY